MVRPSGIVFIALAGLLLGGCASAPPADAPAVVKAAPDGRGVQRVSVIAGNYYFLPSRIVVKAGSPVEVTIRKEGLIPHTFTINAPAAGISVDITLSSEPSTVSFTPKAPGTYRFVCTKKPPLFASHLERGMHGSLEVVP